MKFSRYLLAVALLLVLPFQALAHTTAYYNFQAGLTTPIVYVTLSEAVGDTTAPTPLTNKLYSDFEAYYCTNGGALTQITLATQTVNGAWASGGMVKLSDTTAAGRYRLDLPAAITATAGRTTVFVSYLDTYTADIYVDVGNAYNTLTDASTQKGQGTPSATAPPVDMLNYLYKAWRNRSTTLAGGQYRLYNDDGTTVDQKATVNNVTGRGVVQQTEVATGP